MVSVFAEEIYRKIILNYLINPFMTEAVII